jgi:hypothetical protein
MQVGHHHKGSACSLSVFHEDTASSRQRSFGDIGVQFIFESISVALVPKGSTTHCRMCRYPSLARRVRTCRAAAVAASADSSSPGSHGRLHNFFSASVTGCHCQGSDQRLTIDMASCSAGSSFRIYAAFLTPPPSPADH